MSFVFKLLFFASVFASVLLLGYYLYKKLNERIRNSETNWQLLANSLLLLIVFALLFFGGVSLLIWLYGFFKEKPDAAISNLI